MTPLMLIAAGFVLAMIVGVVLQHRVEMTKARSAGYPDDYERGFADGLDAAARLLEQMPNADGKARDFAGLIRAIKRTR